VRRPRCRCRARRSARERMGGVCKAIAALHVRNIRRVAKIKEQSPADLWREICEELGLDQCEPWPGYPDRLLPAERANGPVSTKMPMRIWLSGCASLTNWSPAFRVRRAQTKPGTLA
jgi:hypothetical protein